MITKTTDLLAEVDGGESVTYTSLWAMFMKGLSKDPDRVAVVAMHQKPGHLDTLVGEAPNQNPTHLALTYAQLKLGASRVASVLSTQGVGRGDNVITFIPNCAEWFVLQWAAALLEATFIPLDVRIVEPARVDDLRYYLKTLSPAAIVVEDDAGLDAVDKTLKELDINLKYGLCLKSERASLNQLWSSLASVSDRTFSTAEDNFPAPENEDPDRTATVMYTSGTSTGIPKGCPHTVRSISNNVANHWAVRADQRSSITVLMTANFRAVWGISTVAFLHTGSTVVMPSETFSASCTIAAVEEYKAESLTCMPPVAYAIAEDPTYSRQRLRSLSHVGVGGDVTTESMIRWVQQVFPDANVKAGHGMTEGSGIFRWPLGATLESVPTCQGVFSAGKVMPGSRIRIVDDNGNIMRRGETGELHIGGLSMVREYLGDVKPELFYRADGESWIITGDRGVVDAEGWVYILGRSKDIIKRGAIPIAPAGLEGCISGQFGIQAAVVDLPHKILGQEPFAVVAEYQSGVDEASIKKLIVDKFGYEYALGGVFTLSQLKMSAWPLNPTGKIMKIELRTAVMERVQAAGGPA